MASVSFTDVMFMVLIFITYIMLLGLAVGGVKIFYVFSKKIFLGVGKSKSRSADANQKTEGLMYLNAGGELRNISSTDENEIPMFSSGNLSRKQWETLYE